MTDYKLIYKGEKFSSVDINPLQYRDDFFQTELNLESDVFYELRKRNDIKPFRINESLSGQLLEIKQFFSNNKNTFFFLFDKGKLIGSILYIDNYIQSLSVNREYQKMGYGSKLTKFAVNRILSSNYSEVILKVMKGNVPALNIYKKLGFEIID